MYAGQHWSKRAEEAQRVHFLVKNSPRIVGEGESVYALKKNPTFPGPVAISITAYFKGRQLDADNICAKLYVDGLKGWLLQDDSPEYVKSVTTCSMKDKDNPRVEIEITALSSPPPEA